MVIEEYEVIFFIELGVVFKVIEEFFIEKNDMFVVFLIFCSIRVVFGSFLMFF